MRWAPPVVVVVMVLAGCGGSENSGKTYTCKDFENGGSKESSLVAGVAKAAKVSKSDASDAINSVCSSGTAGRGPAYSPTGAGKPFAFAVTKAKQARGR
jgi:hypothetical protein